MWRSENIDCRTCALVVITVQLVAVGTGSRQRHTVLTTTAATIGNPVPVPTVGQREKIAEFQR